MLNIFIKNGLSRFQYLIKISPKNWCIYSIILNNSKYIKIGIIFKLFDISSIKSQNFILTFSKLFKI